MSISIIGDAPFSNKDIEEHEKSLLEEFEDVIDRAKDYMEDVNQARTTDDIESVLCSVLDLKEWYENASYQMLQFKMFLEPLYDAVEKLGVPQDDWVVYSWDAFSFFAIYRWLQDDLHVHKEAAYTIAKTIDDSLAVRKADIKMLNIERTMFRFNDVDYVVVNSKDLPNHDK